MEMDSFEEVAAHVPANALVFCDLDNTLIEPIGQFGSVQWEEHYRKCLVASGQPIADAEQAAHERWLEVFPFVKMRLVDNMAPMVIRNLQGRGCIVIGLTARPPETAKTTYKQLSQLGISFNGPESRHTFCLEEVLYENSILFCGIHHKKSEALLAFLKQMDFFQKNVLFIDDKLSHIKDVEGALQSYSLAYIGIRFSKVDSRVGTYDPKIADEEELLLMQTLQ